MVEKDDNMFRVAVQNVGTMPEDSSLEETTDNKNYQLIEFVNKYQVDVLGVTETNRPWTNLDSGQRLRERFRGVFETLRAADAFNVHGLANAGTFRYGGASLLSFDQAAHRAIDRPETDPTGLGRWVSQRCQGRGGATTRIYVGYRPVKNRTGPGTVWQQHRTYFDDQDNDRCPTEAFLEDLWKDMAKAQ